MAVPCLRRFVAGLLTAEALVRSQVNPFEICRGQSGVGTGFAPSTSILHCQYHSTKTPYLSLSTCCTRRPTGEAWDPSKSNALSEFDVSPTFAAVQQFGSGTAPGPTVPAPAALPAPPGVHLAHESSFPDHRPCELRYRPILKSCHEAQEAFSRT
jgi:hypothetical protein